MFVDLGRVCVSPQHLGGRAHCRGTGSSLFDAGSPACWQALWPAPVPPSWPAGSVPDSSKLVPSRHQTWEGKRLETGFSGLTRGSGLAWRAPSDPHPYLAVFKKAVPSPVASRRACGSPFMYKHTRTQAYIPSHIVTTRVCSCMPIIHICTNTYTPSLLLTHSQLFRRVEGQLNWVEGLPSLLAGS